MQQETKATIQNYRHNVSSIGESRSAGVNTCRHTQHLHMAILMRFHAKYTCLGERMLFVYSKRVHICMS